MSYQLKIMRDYPVAFWPLDESSGTIAYDISGCGNHGEYYSGFTHHQGLPLVPGGIKGTLISGTNELRFPVNKDYNGTNIGYPFATNKTSDNDFTIEFWVKLNIGDHTTKLDLLREPEKLIYISYVEGSFKFTVTAEDAIEYEASGYVGYTKKALHIVATYTQQAISLFVDGMLIGYKSLPAGFKFFNDVLNPTKEYPRFYAKTFNSATNSFIIDAVAMYRYALPKSTILTHYINGNTQIEPFQVASKNNGYYFDLNGSTLFENFIYKYPADKKLESFIDQNTDDYIYYDTVTNSLQFYDKTTLVDQDVVLEDYILLPNDIGITSKIEWRGDYGIKVETSVDGTNYVECVNGGVIPQYKIGSYNSSGNLYIKITMSSSAQIASSSNTEFLFTKPFFSFLSIVFYKNKQIYSYNGGGILKKSNVSSPADFTLGTLNYPTLSQNYNNGLRIQGTGGFMVAISYNVNTIEFFFTPISLNSDCALIHFPDGMNNPFKYSWLANGSISSQNISKIYVNNVEKAGETSISNVFTAGQMHHVVIVLNGVATGNLYFNHLYPSTSAGPQNLYNNLILYPSSLDGSDIDYNYKLWTGAPSKIIVDPVIIVDEKTIKYDSDDWVVVSST